MAFHKLSFLFPKVSLNNKLKPDISFLCHRCSLKTENPSILSNFSAFTAKAYVRVIYSHFRASVKDFRLARQWKKIDRQ